MAQGPQGTAPQNEFQGHTGEVLRRLQELHPKLIDLSLGRLENLLARLGHPERNLPPVIHVAGTNGKGSTSANLRAIAEASGLRVHVMTSPHLLHVTERFRLAGTLVTEEKLVSTLEEIERVNNDAPITVFEVLTAAGFLLFSRTPADLTILEVGLGGRFDATNVIESPKACIITSISLDHQAFLGSSLQEIAREKAGIIKPHVPVIIAPQHAEAFQEIKRIAHINHAPLYQLERNIFITEAPEGLTYSDDSGSLSLPFPALRGSHQAQNSALAIAALRKSGLALSEHSYQAIANTHWPARLQTLRGNLATVLPKNWELILDGGHNPGAGEALAITLQRWTDRPLHLIVGLKDSKDASGFLRPLIPYATSLYAVSEKHQHLAMPIDNIIDSATKAGGKALPGPTIQSALHTIIHNHNSPTARVLICGSLYLAGCALGQDGTQLT